MAFIDASCNVSLQTLIREMTVLSCSPVLLFTEAFSDFKSNTTGFLFILFFYPSTVQLRHIYWSFRTFFYNFHPQASFLFDSASFLSSLFLLWGLFLPFHNLALFSLIHCVCLLTLLSKSHQISNVMMKHQCFKQKCTYESVYSYFYHLQHGVILKKSLAAQ